MRDQVVWLSILLIAFVCICSGRHERRDSLHSKLVDEDEQQIAVTGSGRNTHRENKYQKQKMKAQFSDQVRQKHRRNFREINGLGCSEITCAAHEVCVSKLSDGHRTVSCVHSKQALLRRGRGRGMKQDLTKNIAHASYESGSLKEKVQRMKNQANDFELRRVKKQAKRFNSIIEATSVHKTVKDPSASDVQNESTEKTPLECYRKELNAVGEKLLDQFKQQQDNQSAKRKKEKRNSTKKELHEDDECICQSPVSWQFQQLDTDADGQLTNAETSRVLANASSSVSWHCLASFVRACDHNADSTLSEKEWCCCFADVLPPCLTAMKLVPSILIRGQPSVMPGAVVPQCDDDGFYLPTQCDSSTGSCWCVDHNGHKLDAKNADGNPNC